MSDENDKKWRMYALDNRAKIEALEKIVQKMGVKVDFTSQESGQSLKEIAEIRESIKSHSGESYTATMHNLGIQLNELKERELLNAGEIRNDKQDFHELREGLITFIKLQKALAPESDILGEQYDLLLKCLDSPKSEVDIANMVLKRCPYCTELFSVDANTLEIRGNLKEDRLSGGTDEKTEKKGCFKCIENGHSKFEPKTELREYVKKKNIERKKRNEEEYKDDYADLKEQIAENKADIKGLNDHTFKQVKELEGQIAENKEKFNKYKRKHAKDLGKIYSDLVGEGFGGEK